MSIAVSPPKTSKSRRAKLHLLVGYLIGLACLVWVFHDIHPGRFFRSIGGINWPLAALGILIEAVSYFVMGVRWRILLKPEAPVSALRTAQAIYCGLFLNQILPLRLGEVGRGLLVSHWSGLNFLSVLPSMALERFFEAFWMASGLGALALFVPLPRNLIQGGKTFGAVIVGLAVGLLVLILRKPGSDRSPSLLRAPGRLRRFARIFLWELRTELREIGLKRRFFLAFGLTLVVLCLWALPFWTIMRACGIREPLLVGFAVWLLTHLGIALPNSPGNIGSYQFFCVLALLLFGVDKTAASSFSVTVFILVSIPQVAIGAVSLAKSGMTISTLSEKVSSFRSHVFARTEPLPEAPLATRSEGDATTAPDPGRAD
jgi:uncharacterized protein (TIRG00374 family)